MSPQTANHMRLDGKVAVITGGAQGVGLGIAQEFVDYGATVIIADLNAETLKRAGAALGPNATTAVVDVTDLDQVRAMYDDIIATHGRLAAVVANVGAGDSNGKAVRLRLRRERQGRALHRSAGHQPAAWPRPADSKLRPCRDVLSRS
jgi:NAD(P)-dependent dehydrogenase (short-subunit alcohol dehydrogenase family)